MTDRDTISHVVESLFEDWIDKNQYHPLAVENMRLLEADALAMLREHEAKTGHWNGPECSRCHAILEKRCRFEYCPHCGAKMERD